MTKVRLTEELILKAKQVFDAKSTILAGEGLTRGELRRLVNAKRLKKRLVQVGQQYRCYYMRPGTHQKLKDMARERKQKEAMIKEAMPPEAKKPNLFMRIWLFIKKVLRKA